MKLLEMGKDMKIKHSASSPPEKNMGTFFLKKPCMGEQTFFDKLMGGFSYMETMIRSCCEEGEVSQIYFPVILNTVNLRIFPGCGGRHAGK